jgi:hypothetical protein
MENNKDERRVILVEEDIIREIIYGREDITYSLINETIDSIGRWLTTYRVILENKEEGTFWEFFYTKGNTECQEQDFFNGNKYVSLKEVFPKEVTIIEYV